MPWWNTGGMNTSSPADLAIAFRSFTRRLEQAGDDDTSPAAIAVADAAVHEAVVAAATQLGSAATFEGIAAAIDHRHLADWTDRQLTELQAEADAVAKAIRELDQQRS